MEEPSGPDDRCQYCDEQLHPSDNYCPSCGTETQFADSTGTQDRQREEQAPLSGPDTAGPREPRANDQHPSGGHRPAADGRSPPGNPGGLVGRESPLRAIGVAVGLSAAGIVVPLLTLSILAAIVASAGLLNAPAIVLLTVLQFAWFAGLGVWYLRRRGYDWEHVKAYFGIEMPSLRDYGLILVTWLVMIIAAVIVGTILMEVVAGVLGAEDTEPAENPVGEIIAENPEIVLGAIAFMFLVVGPCEEILFRGVIQNRLRERFSKIPGIAIASFLFALVHVVALAGQDPVGISMTITILFVTSLGLGWIYEYTGNLVVPSLLHGFHNSVIVAITAAGAIYDLEPEEAILRLPELVVIL